MRILICGSCVSHDIFSLVKHEHKIAGYLPRMSMATAFGAPVPEHIIAAAKQEIESLTHRFWALNDLEKRMEKVLTSTAYDLLLLDFIDERMSLAITEEGSLFTCGDPFRKAAADRWSYEKIASKSAQHYELWEKGLATFATFVDPQKVFVNKVFWASTANDGSQFDERKVTNCNRFLAKLYEHLETHYRFNFISYEPEIFLGDAAHKWDKSPVHYTQHYYAEAMQALDAIAVGKAEN